MRLHFRCMIHRDLPEVLAIESESFEDPWLEEDFIRCLQQRSCVNNVFEYDGRIVSFMNYELIKTQIHVLNFATAVEYRRRGVGSQMVARLIRKLTNQRRTRIALEVRETNMPAQLFFRAKGFRAVSVLRNYYTVRGKSEDAYAMQYCLYQERPPAFRSVNRVKQWIQ